MSKGAVVLLTKQVAIDVGLVKSRRVLLDDELYTEYEVTTVRPSEDQCQRSLSWVPANRHGETIHRRSCS
jgi:hypothetical protein